ncbi:UNVERIFIED_CONTAM: hypothetical protein GTU68_016637 [Idotea baltica]|nr:hypothetical protein [Idotea baltica]
MEFLQVAEEAARLGGSILQEWSTKFTASEKSPANLVTEADLASEKAIFEYISERFPDHRFMGEEGLSKEDGNSPYRWIIDPLDGTSNYVHQFPYYAVSIGLERGNELIAGVIYDPTRDEVFSAETGSGAFLNGKPLKVSKNSELSQAMCMASLPVKSDRNHPAVQQFLSVLVSSRKRSNAQALPL